MKIKITFFYISISVLSFSLEIDSVKFNKIVHKNEIVQKEFSIKNSGANHLKYLLEIEGKNDHIKVNPKQFIVETGKEKRFKILVKGKGNTGSNIYYLLIKEKNIDPSSKKSLTLNKTYRIKQEYFLGEKTSENIK